MPRPKHKLDQLLDSMKKKTKLRRLPATRRGERVQTAKLTADDVSGIRAGYMLGFSTAELSRNFSSLLTLRHSRDVMITRQQIWRIVARKDWKHLPDPKVRPEDLAPLEADPSSEPEVPVVPAAADRLGPDTPATI